MLDNGAYYEGPDYSKIKMRRHERDARSSRGRFIKSFKVGKPY